MRARRRRQQFSQTPLLAFFGAAALPSQCLDSAQACGLGVKDVPTNRPSSYEVLSAACAVAHSSLCFSAGVSSHPHPERHRRRAPSPRHTWRPIAFHGSFLEVTARDVEAQRHSHPARSLHVWPRHFMGRCCSRRCWYVQDSAFGGRPKRKVIEKRGCIGSESGIPSKS